MQCNIMHQACDGFYFILKNIWNWAKKTDLKILVYAFLRPMSYTLICQI